MAKFFGSSSNLSSGASPLRVNVSSKRIFNHVESISFFSTARLRESSIFNVPILDFATLHVSEKESSSSKRRWQRTFCTFSLKGSSIQMPASMLPDSCDSVIHNIANIPRRLLPTAGHWSFYTPCMWRCHLPGLQVCQAPSCRYH